MLVPEAFDLPVDTSVLDRLGIAYRVEGMHSSLFWYRSYAPAVGEDLQFTVSFLSESWCSIVPWLYHADFDAGYNCAWPLSGWRRPDRDLPTAGRVELTDVPDFCGSLWGQLAAGLAVEPVEPAVRSQFRCGGFGLFLAGDPPEDPEGRALWLLNTGCDSSVETRSQRCHLARGFIQAQLDQLWALEIPVWAGALQGLRSETQRQASAWGFRVPKV